MYGHISHPVVIIRSIRIVARSALEIVSISVCFMRFKRGRDVGTRRARLGVTVHVNPHVYRAGIHTELSSGLIAVILQSISRIARAASKIESVFNTFR